MEIVVISERNFGGSNGISGAAGRGFQRGIPQAPPASVATSNETRSRATPYRRQRNGKRCAQSNAPRLSCAARARGRTRMKRGAQLYVGAQREFCQDRAAAAS